MWRNNNRWLLKGQDASARGVRAHAEIRGEKLVASSDCLANVWTIVHDWSFTEEAIKVTDQMGRIGDLGETLWKFEGLSRYC